MIDKKHWRERVNMSQSDLAYLTKKTMPYISDFENDKQQPRLDFLDAYRKALRLSKDEWDALLEYEIERRR